ncbi:MAG: 3-hydroxy-3-methylglutaryl CoA synthase, partial [Gammaproteobacteria bacterium]|nr:3-hydroxy-3-methylglutaryl CoA synthase [Gammaproteobacteria bacterium]
MVGITAFGGYIPKRRLVRQAVVDAHVWADPGLARRGRGERAMCNWDEDAVTMAVEAVRSCLNSGGTSPDALYFASTSAPFADRQNAGIVSTALSLPESIASVDLGSSQKAGVSAFIQALGAVQGGLYHQALVVASEKRRVKAGSAGELAYGDGAAALAVGTDGLLAEFVAAQSATVDFVDHFRSATEAYDYTWEERWIRDEGLAKIVPPCINQALAKAGAAAADVDHFIMPSTIGRAVAGIARQVGLRPEAIADNLAGVMGEAGAAHPLVMLLHVLETRAKPGDLLLLAGFGQGCDVVVLRTTEALAQFQSAQGVSDALANRQPEDNYQKFLAFNDLIQLEKGMRAENDDYKTALSVTYRKRDMLLGLVGGRCGQCGALQFPRTEVCVNPQCGAHGAQEPHSFRDEPATVLTWAADYLAYPADP